MGQETSLKELLQGMTPDSVELMRGTVTQASPLKIQMEGDPKHIITDRITVVPRHLTNYTTTCTINWVSDNRSGGSGYDAFASHNHGITGTKPITINNALVVGDVVYVLSLNKGKLYYILDRISS